MKTREIELVAKRDGCGIVWARAATGRLMLCHPGLTLYFEMPSPRVGDRAWVVFSTEDSPDAYKVVGGHGFWNVVEEGGQLGYPLMLRGFEGALNAFGRRQFFVSFEYEVLS